jgi:hypothetical protein
MKDLQTAMHRIAVEKSHTCATSSSSSGERHGGFEVRMDVLRVIMEDLRVTMEDLRSEWRI